MDASADSTGRDATRDARDVGVQAVSSTADEFGRLTLRVRQIAREAEDVVSVTVVRPDDKDLPAWSPGAHVDLDLGSGLIRQYSLCGDPADAGAWTVAVLRQPGGRGGSLAVHDRLRVGDDIDILGLRNRFPLVDAQKYVFVAGGIGITPLLPMMGHIGDTRQWTLLYGGRNANSMAFVPRIRSLPGDILIRPQDEYGLLDLDTLLAEIDDETAVYCCGPERLLSAMELRAESWPAGTLHTERFRAQIPVESKDRGAFEVRLSRSGQSLTVSAEQTIVDALMACGVRVPTSCLEGVCGTCETRVLEGVPDHRDSVLTDEEQASGETMMVCCSRAASDSITLDL